MTAFFVLLAAVMLIVALGLVLPPLLRGGSPRSDPAAAARRRMKVLQEALDTGVLSKKEFAAKKAELGSQLLGALDGPAPRSRSAFFAAVAVALLLPAGAIVLYRIVGEPRALDPASIPPPAAQATAEHGQDMDQAIAKLAEKLKQNPDDAGGWTLLGRAYLETERFSEARDALKHAHDLAPDEPDVNVAYAEAMTLAGDSHRIDGEAKTLIDAALKADPQNQRGLWLLGVSAYQDRDYNGAVATWNRLLGLLPADSTVTQSVKAQIARAEAERDGREPPVERTPARAAASEQSTASAVPAQSAATAAADHDGPHLTVKVALDAKLAAKAAPGDTVFVYAKAASGPPMPLAVQRLLVEQLPATVTLTDGMGMLPNMKLSQFPQVIVGARVSKSGNAIAQSGDLQTTSKTLDVTTTTPIALTIDQVVP